MQCSQTKESVSNEATQEKWSSTQYVLKDDDLYDVTTHEDHILISGAARSRLRFTDRAGAQCTRRECPDDDVDVSHCIILASVFDAPECAVTRADRMEWPPKAGDGLWQQNGETIIPHFARYMQLIYVLPPSGGGQNQMRL
jgi:hypothetical protein